MKLHGDNAKRFYVHADGATEEISDGGTKTFTPPRSPRSKSPRNKDKDDDSDPEHKKNDFAHKV